MHKPGCGGQDCEMTLGKLERVEAYSWIVNSGETGNRLSVKTVHSSLHFCAVWELKEKGSSPETKPLPEELWEAQGKET